MSKKILAVASQGGHWIQLKRLSDVLGRYNTIYLTTYDGEKKELLKEDGHYQVKDASRWNKFKLLIQLFNVVNIFLKVKPDVVITTGASVGIWAIALGRLLGCKTIWIDSLANYEKISLSGKLVKNICSYHLTQWAHLTDKKTQFKGTVL